MGTDIHFYVERRINNKWETCDKWSNEGEYWHVPHNERFYSKRNYDLFAILADVRNGLGFAGVLTGTGFIPLTQPRGFPLDSCEEIQRLEIEHTPSYCTLQELLEYDWTRETLKRGVIALKEYLKWKPRNERWGEWPESWSGSISGPNIIIISEEDALTNKIPPGRIYVDATWRVCYYECCKDFLTETMPRLWRLGKPEDVRCVFFFDS